MEFEKDYFVLDLPKEVQEVIKLKSAMNGMSCEKLVLKAINQFENDESDTMPCPHCKRILNRKPYAIRKHVKVGQSFEINVRDYPLFKCTDCNQEFHDVRVDTYFNRILERYVQSLLLEAKTVPNKIYFNEMIDLKDWI